MGTKDKSFYEPPTTEVFTVIQEGVICQSTTETEGSPTFNRFNDEQEW